MERSLRYDLGLGYAVIDPGLTVDADKGELIFDVSGWNSTGAPRKLKLASEAKTIKVKANVPRGLLPWGLALERPVYRLGGAKVSPHISVRIGVDLGVYEWSYSFGPLIMGKIELGTLELPAHQGTNPNFRLQVGTRKKL